MAATSYSDSAHLHVTNSTTKSTEIKPFKMCTAYFDYCIIHKQPRAEW